MAIDWTKPIYEEQKKNDEDKYLPHQLDRETVYLIQFACRAVLFSVFLSLYVTAVGMLLHGIANENGWLASGGIVLGLVVGRFHYKAHDASRKW